MAGSTAEKTEQPSKEDGNADEAMDLDASPDSQGVEKEGVVDAIAVDPADGVDHMDVEAALGDQGEQMAMPKSETPGVEGAGEGLHHLPVDAEVMGPEDDWTSVDLEGTDPDLTVDFDELLDRDQGYGGADGRNPASDAGGPTLPGQEPYAGANEDIEAKTAIIEGSMSDAFTPEQQAQLKALNEKIQAANKAGNTAEVDNLNKEAAKLVESFNNGTSTDTGDTAAGEAGGEEFFTGTATVVLDENGELVGTPAQKALADKVGGEAPTGHRQALADVMREIDDNSRPSTSSTHDVGEEQGLSGPDLWEDFTDAYHDQQLEGLLGSEVDPNPNDDSWSMSGVPDTDFDSYTAEYSQDLDPEDGTMRYIDGIPDEEFLEL